MRRDERMDEFLFGKRRNSEPEPEREELKKEEPKKEFNLMETAGTIMETYEQLSPYVKHLKNHATKFIKKK
ncbi:hypothetical protein CHI12_12735 [Terribacillus saccharophilus]|jgi:hypothetical protein|uniref:Uncharacterized protein n=1 Tax=Terribacillus saccharophilus TaxID=361277 RepID=A0A268HB71_9BACI|nr:MULTISPECIES: hypothetical protein [Terribacillus]PAD34999.1 hypothetical protein CHH56_11345 [Terribacillus saccharophilus]PAD95711.1 hypothetical protein CHH50_11575 [Terribacillus saccharophilus]PAD99281.1 hypothetical protein CHH48_12475 [Terribacillus saccharophilus]PAE07122.1 hypothetical protein CHI12_12735 [Terribacillus saccharophilus]